MNLNSKLKIQNSKFKIPPNPVPTGIQEVNLNFPLDQCPPISKLPCLIDTDPKKMKPLATLLACFVLSSCGDNSSETVDVPADIEPIELTRIIKYQYDGSAKAGVLVTDFGGAANKTVTIDGKEVTASVEIKEFDHLWNAQTEIPIIKASILGEEFTGIDTETHHIISYVTTGATRTAEMHAVPNVDVTPEFKKWLQRLLKTNGG